MTKCLFKKQLYLKILNSFDRNCIFKKKKKKVISLPLLICILATAAVVAMVMVLQMVCLHENNLEMHYMYQTKIRE